MILSAIAERLKRRSKDDFRGRHFEAPLILQAVCWYLRYPLSYRDIEVRRGKQGERGASIRMRKCRRVREGRRA
jgi:transposase, IS6 family